MNASLWLWNGSASGSSRPSGPALVMDANRNRSAIAFDALGGLPEGARGTHGGEGPGLEQEEGHRDQLRQGDVRQGQDQVRETGPVHRISLEGIQVHHTFDELAKNPAQALETTNLSFQQGHAGSKGSAHNFAHEVNKAHAAGVKNPGQHVKTTMAAEGVQPRVPEFSPAPHVPHAPHAPKVPMGKKIGGWIGLAIGVGISGYVLLETGDVYAAGQAVNPAANTTGRCSATGSPLRPSDLPGPAGSLPLLRGDPQA
ncbi:hypothetical protein [Nonomuraea sp. NPDC050202]|uniref:hypothetical protein n=1 Tax=Nonomuraea sp. NPDC050202 TaxID=3155035 RepID=UPI0033F6E279